MLLMEININNTNNCHVKKYHTLFSIFGNDISLPIVQKEFSVANNIINGFYNEYDIFGNPTKMIHYKNGLKNGCCYINTNDYILCANYNMDILDGPYYEFDSTIYRTIVTTYKNNKIDGIYKEAFIDKIVCCSYKDGVLDGPYHEYYPKNFDVYKSNVNLLDSNEFTKFNLKISCDYKDGIPLNPPVRYKNTPYNEIYKQN